MQPNVTTPVFPVFILQQTQKDKWTSDMQVHYTFVYSEQLEKKHTSGVDWNYISK